MNYTIYRAKTKRISTKEKNLHALGQKKDASSLVGKASFSFTIKKFISTVHKNEP